MRVIACCFSSGTARRSSCDCCEAGCLRQYLRRRRWCGRSRVRRRWTRVQEASGFCSTRMWQRVDLDIINASADTLFRVLVLLTRDARTAGAGCGASINRVTYEPGRYRVRACNRINHEEGKNHHRISAQMNSRWGSPPSFSSRATRTLTVRLMSSVDGNGGTLAQKSFTIEFVLSSSLRTSSVDFNRR